jgi:hypothetical protein
MSYAVSRMVALYLSDTRHVVARHDVSKVFSYRVLVEKRRFSRWRRVT